MSQQWKSENIGGDEDVQMPLGVSGDGAREESYGEPKPRINTSTLGLFAAFGAALVALYLLGLQNKPRAASADTAAREEQTASEIDRIIHDSNAATNLDGVIQDTKRLVTILMKYIGSAPAEGKLPDNPFGEKPAEAVVQAADKAPAIAEPVDPTLLPVFREFKSLKLQMVMLGNPPHAMVSNKIVTVGTRFSLLTVKQIQSDGVVLTDGSSDYQLRMSGPSIEKE